MKTKTTLTLAVLGLAAGLQPVLAQLNIPSDGSDGPLVITESTVIDLGQAVTGNWDANNSANAGKGIYDPQKWAVVFKYASVTVQGGATVTFKNHPSRAPVVWLVQGDVTINGTVSLDGQNAQPPPLLAEPGPGGYRGGSGNYAPGAEDAAGFGPGGGARRVGTDSHGNSYGAGGSYGSPGLAGSSVYGNPSLIPLIGGSGGAGRQSNDAFEPTAPVRFSGGAGGGAFAVLCAGGLSVSGRIQANGGHGIRPLSGSSLLVDHPGGSGGGVRLVSGTLAGGGAINCLGGGGAISGGVGRIRIERVTNTSTLTNVAPDPSVVELAAGATPQIWLPASGPSVRVVSIGGNTAPADPRAEFGAIGADVVLPQVTNTTVVVETTNVEQASVVTVRATPRANGNFTEAAATVTEVVTEDPLVIRWTANVPVQDGYSAMQVKVVRP